MIYDFKPTREDYLKFGIEPILPLKPGFVVGATNDKVFKNLVNDINNIGFLAKIISLVIDIDFDYLVKNIRLASNNTLEGSVFEHFNEQDVIVRLGNMRINIEMSINNRDFNIIKNQTTAFKLAGNAYKVGERYNENHVFYQICIENYDLYHNDLLVTEVNLTDVSSGNNECVNDFYKEFHVNLKRLSNSCYNDLDEREKYFKLLTLNRIDDLREISNGDEIMEKAVDKIIDLSSDPSFISELERKQIEEYARSVAEEKGKKEAIKEGEKIKQIEIAKNLLNENIDISIISKATGLSIEEIENLK